MSKLFNTLCRAGIDFFLVSLKKVSTQLLFLECSRGPRYGYARLSPQTIPVCTSSVIFGTQVNLPYLKEGSPVHGLVMTKVAMV